MSETKQTREMARAAREFTDAARELTAAMDRLSGLLQHRERGYVPGEALRDVIGSGGLPEEEARELATRLVRRARREGDVREPEAPAPSPEEVRARREALSRREAS